LVAQEYDDDMDEDLTPAERLAKQRAQLKKRLGEPLNSSCWLLELQGFREWPVQGIHADWPPQQQLVTAGVRGVS
jgi:hypothetical protein